MDEETNQQMEDEIDQMEDNNNLQQAKQEDHNQHRDEDLKQESELQNLKKDIDVETVDGVIDADSENSGQIPLNVKEQESKLYQNDQSTVKEEDNHTPNKSEQELSSEMDSLNHAGNETGNESIETGKMSVTENVQILGNVTELHKDEEKNLQEDKNVDEKEDTAQIEDSNSGHENEKTDEHDDVEEDGTLGEEEKKEDTSANQSDPQEESSDTVVSSADKEPPKNQDNIDDKVGSASETSPDERQNALQSDSVKTEITNEFKTQSDRVQEERTSAGSVSHTGEGPLQTFDDSLRPYTRQTGTDRPVSISSFVYSAKDFPTPDYEQYVRPTPSVVESDNDRPESKASRVMKSGTSRGDGTKSVTFADDVKSDEIGKQDSEGPQEDDSVTDKEELFSTAVSEEKIEEATRKLRIGSADSSGSENSLLKEVFGLQRVKLVSGSDLLNKRANEHYERGCQLHNSGNMFAAIIAFDKAINLCPSEVRFYLMRGEAYLQVTDFQSAIQSFKKACVLRPTSDIYYSKLAFVYYLQGQSLFDQCLFTEALESFSRAAEMRPEIIGYHTRSIACLAALERHGECLALVNKRLELERSNPDLYIMRARLHLLFRNTSLSYYDLKDALTLDPEQPEAQKILQDLEKRAQDNRDFAVRLQLQGKFKEAMQKITLAIEMNPSVAEFHLLRGAIHRRLHDFNAAIDDFLLSLDKTDHDESDNVYMDAQRQLLLTYNDFAVDCFLGGHFDEAILLLNKAIKGEKRERGLYVNRGDCFFRLGELHFSLADYHQALEIDPHDSLARGRIAAIHSEFGSVDYEEHSYQDAEARFTVAIQHNPRNSQYYLSRAKVRFMLENHSDARQDILISLHLNPNNDAIHSLLARLFPGKSVADVLRSRAAREAKHILDHAVVTASPVKLPAISRLAGSGLLQSLDLFTDTSKVTEGEGSPFVLFMNEDDFNKVLARRKKMVAGEVKSSLRDRQSLRRSGPKLKPQPPPRTYELKGGHWKTMDTQPPPGWRQFGLGIEMKDS